MNASNQIHLNQSLQEILEAKLHYHTDQLAFHKEELKQTNEAIRLFKQQQEEPAPALPLVQVADRRETGSSGKPVAPPADLERITQRVARPHVERFFKAHNGQYTTAEIFDLLKQEQSWKEEDRAKWISAISSTLNTLVAYKKVNSYETGVGRIKRYEANVAGSNGRLAPIESGPLFQDNPAILPTATRSKDE